ncbi:hypothetical protein DL96DRAFT_1617808 [Flagelloscypha sp. PMI_526]|nr:hypothetical protein DL96DRAFT_1617808 [Flagelloscypha sp. PMI_526]
MTVLFYFAFGTFLLLLIPQSFSRSFHVHCERSIYVTIVTKSTSINDKGWVISPSMDLPSFITFYHISLPFRETCKFDISRSAPMKMQIRVSTYHHA